MGTKGKHHSSTAYSTEQELHCGLVPQLQRYTAAKPYGAVALQKSGTHCFAPVLKSHVNRDVWLDGQLGDDRSVTSLIGHFVVLSVTLMWRWRVTLNDANVEQAKKGDRATKISQKLAAGDDWLKTKKSDIHRYLFFLRFRFCWAFLYWFQVFRSLGSCLLWSLQVLISKVRNLFQGFLETRCWSNFRPRFELTSS